MRIFNERSGFEIRASFKAESGLPALPSSVHWRLWCEDADEAVTDWAQASVDTLQDEDGVTGYKSSIEVPGSALVLRDQSKRRETWEVQIAAGRDTDRETTERVPFYRARLKR